MVRFKQIKNLVVLCALLSASLIKGANRPVAIKKEVTTQQPQDANQTETPRITIWIHGTKTLGGLSDFLHATPHLGIAHASALSSNYRLSNVITTLAATEPKKFPLEHFYTYGWSGKLSFEVRKQTAHELYQAIKNLLTSYRDKYGVTPHITLITHSHGGNVVLNLAALEIPENDVSFETILLACPVQQETKHLIKSNLFTKIYSLYSKNDWLQVLDPQGLYITQHNKKRHWRFSDREFPCQENVYQNEISINNKGLSHIDFVSHDFARLLPTFIDAMHQIGHNKKQATKNIINVTKKS